jgi:hypothetical protein
MGAERVVVISQPMYFPWVGLLEQARLAQVWVHYDDVQFSKGSFTNRVQLKTAEGPRWLTVPIANRRLDSRIDELLVDESSDWRSRQRGLLQRACAGAPFLDDSLALLARAHAVSTGRVVDVVQQSFTVVREYFGLPAFEVEVSSSALGCEGRSWARVLELVQRFGGTRYVTGHGARNYLDHQAFEAAGVSVEYLDYQKRPYPQAHGAFSPFVSTLDLVAWCGPSGRAVISSGSVSWRSFLPSVVAVEAS